MITTSNGVFTLVCMYTIIICIDGVTMDMWLYMPLGDICVVCDWLCLTTVMYVYGDNK